MNDVSKLSGASPVSPTSNRVWKPPRKQRPGDRSTGKRNESNSEKDEERRQDTARSAGLQALITNENEDRGRKGEALSYGAGGLKKPRNHKVDIII